MSKRESHIVKFKPNSGALIGENKLVQHVKDQSFLMLNGLPVKIMPPETEQQFDLSFLTPWRDLFINPYGQVMVLMLGTALCFTLTSM